LRLEDARFGAHIQPLTRFESDVTSAIEEKTQRTVAAILDNPTDNEIADRDGIAGVYANSAVILPDHDAAACIYEHR